MKERPILMSAPMVRAILAGNKNQTRRAVKQYINSHVTRIEPKDVDAAYPAGTARELAAIRGRHFACFGPITIGQTKECELHTLNAKWSVGDQLWVKETCRAYEQPENGKDGVVYSADNTFRVIENTKEASEAWVKMFSTYGKRGAIVPSIFMPRWASRITLEITEIRVQRLQDISEEDAKAEGACQWWLQSERLPISWKTPARSAFKHLWCSINGPESWAENPYCWCLSFKKLQPKEQHAIS